MHTSEALVLALLAPWAFGASASRVRESSRNTTAFRSGAVAGILDRDSDTGIMLRLDKPKFKTKFKSKGRARGPSNTRGDKSDRDRSKNNVTEIGKCEEPFPAPDQAVIRCPEDCPLMRFHPDKLCHWRCISEEKCASFPGVIDKREGYCFVCAVPGCKRCASTEQVCRECHDGFELKGEECVSTSTWKWMPLLAVLGVVGVLFLAYIVHLAWRPVVSQGALDWGVEHRSKSKARQDEGNHKLYNLNMSLCDQVTSAGGVGAALHFSWQRVTLGWSFVVTLAAMAVVGYHGRLNMSDMGELAPMHDEAEGICSERLDDLGKKEFEALRIHILWLTGFVYVGTSVGAIYWAWYQQRRFAKHEEGTTDMRDYALWCRGFPQELEIDRPAGSQSSKLEEEYKQYFRSTWGAGVIGVSIAWDMEGLEERVKGAVAKIVHELEREHRAKNRDIDGLSPAEAASYTSTPPASHRAPGQQPSSRASCFCYPMVEAIDGIWWGEIPPCIAGHHEEEPQALSDKAEALELIKDLPTTGSCFVILKTERDMNACKDKPLPRFRGEHDIEVFAAEGGAETVLWDGFTVTDQERRWLMFVGLVQVLCVVGIWTLAFWGPYTLYILSWGGIAGASQGDATVGMVVGMLITVGNQIVYAACGTISENVRFGSRDLRDSYYTGLYTFAVFANTVLDMWLVSIMALGWQRDAAADPSALVRNPSMQHAIFTQLIFYLWPCTLLLPFLLEPVVLNIGPYFLAKWLVRSRKRCTKQEAEECLAPPPFDLNRYGDNLINIMMVCLFFLLTGVTLWWIFAMLTISLWVVFCWDCYRFKRGTMRTHFATQDIDVLANYITAIPCAILASGFVFKARGGQGMVRSWDPDSFLSDHPEIWIEVSLAFFGHLLLHNLILALIVPKCIPSSSGEAGEDADSGPEGPRDLITYQVVAERFCCNWFNANPVHCIRSRYLYQHEPAHVFYQPGREYLHQKNNRPQDRDALIIYEAEEFEKETDIMQDVTSASREAYETAYRDAQDVVSRLRSPSTPGASTP